MGSWRFPLSFEEAEVRTDEFYRDTAKQLAWFGVAAFFAGWLAGALSMYALLRYL